MKKIIKNILIGVSIALLIIAIILPLSLNVFAQGRGFGGGSVASGGSGSGNGVRPGHKTNNYANSSVYGTFWISVPVDWEGQRSVVDILKTKRNYAFDLNGAGKTKIYSCPKGTNVYILVTPLSVSGLAGPDSNTNSIRRGSRDKLYKNVKKARKKVSDARWELPEGAEVVDTKFAEKQFNKFSDFHKTHFGQTWGGVLI